MEIILGILKESWIVLEESALYILFGMFIAGLIKVFLSPGSVVKHLGKGKISSVVKAALFGIPLPICSCGVLPTAASLRKQGANKGAVTSFLISTPESGVDSIALTYALMDPLMTLARPISGFAAAFTAGTIQNFVGSDEGGIQSEPDLSCPIDNCCDGTDCPPAEHKNHHSFTEKALSGMRYAFGDLWAELATWFAVGILLAGVITYLIPADFMGTYLGGGLISMLLMLSVGIPLYICATGSTPIAAAMIMKGVSPGTALVFLIAGPATNAAGITMLFKIIGKQATAIYLGTLAVMAVLCGLVLDWVYLSLAIDATAVMGQASETFPAWLKAGSAILLIAMSIKPIYGSILAKLGLNESGCSDGCCATETETSCSTESSSCGCGHKH